MSDRDWLTTGEVAAELGLAHISVKRAIQQGRMQATAVNPRLNLVSRDEVDRYRNEVLGKRGPKPHKLTPESSPNGT